MDELEELGRVPAALALNMRLGVPRLLHGSGRTHDRFGLGAPHGRGTHEMRAAVRSSATVVPGGWATTGVP
jgi:hypothetical protein